MSSLIGRIEAKEAKLGIIGMGYVGLPLAVEFAKGGIHTTGVDLSTEKVHYINSGESYIGGVPNADVAALVKAGKLSATTDFSALSEVDCICICVPTPLSKTKDPDISYIVAACDEIARYAHKDILVVLESTTYPGSTEELILPHLGVNGAQAGEDFFLAFSPERVDPGNHQWTTRNTPKVIGGMTPQCAATAVALYQHAVDTVIPVSSPSAAEMVKLLENRTPQTVAIIGTSYAEVGFNLGPVRGDKRTLVSIAALDNLLKGGAGQAVQSMNICMGLPDDAGFMNYTGIWP